MGNKSGINWKNHLVELFVVILGITIAFTVDKYNENRKEAWEMRLAIESIADDLKRDIRTFDEGQIPNNQKKADELEFILNKLRNEELDNDSLVIFLGRMLGSANSRITIATYETIKASGRLDDIPDVDLKRKIIAHYENNFRQSDYLSNSNIAYYQKLSDYIAEHSTAIFDGNFGDKKLMRDPTFRSMVAIWRNMITFKVKEYERMSASSADLLQTINDYLE